MIFHLPSSDLFNGDETNPIANMFLNWYVIPFRFSSSLDFFFFLIRQGYILFESSKLQNQQTNIWGSIPAWPISMLTPYSNMWWSKQQNSNEASPLEPYTPHTTGTITEHRAKISPHYTTTDKPTLSIFLSPILFFFFFFFSQIIFSLQNRKMRRRWINTNFKFGNWRRAAKSAKS